MQACGNYLLGLPARGKQHHLCLSPRRHTHYLLAALGVGQRTERGEITHFLLILGTARFRTAVMNSHLSSWE